MRDGVSNLNIDGEIPATVKYHGDGVSRPCFIMIHGFQQSRQSAIPFCRLAFDRGFDTVAIDARSHGDRIRSGLLGALNFSKKSTSLFTEILTGTATDVSRVIDYLASNLGARKFALAGFSMGGLITYITISREKRVNSAVSMLAGSISELLIQGSKMLKQFRIEKHLSSFILRTGKTLMKKIDVLSFADKCPPTPLLIIAGEADEIVPLASILKAYKSLRANYKISGALSNLKLLTYPGVGHKITDEMMIDAIQWLTLRFPSLQ